MRLSNLWCNACVIFSLLTSSIAFADQEIRVATWNVLTVGEPGSSQYEAAYAVLARLGADVVAVQEVASKADSTYVAQLAVDLGYPHVTVAPPVPSAPCERRSCRTSTSPLVSPGQRRPCPVIPRPMTSLATSFRPTWTLPAKKMTSA